jgi:ribosomal protein L37AE/L43A
MGKVSMGRSYDMKLGPIELLSLPGKMAARVECATCGIHDDWGLSKIPEPAILIRHFNVRGWNISRKATCPECQKKRVKRMAEPTIKTNAAEKPEASDAAKKAKRLIYQALEDYYNETTKAYRNGKSDKSVADEVGTSEAFVRQIREQDFGPLIDIGEMRFDMAEFEKRGESLAAAVKDLICMAKKMEAHLAKLISARLN